MHLLIKLQALFFLHNRVIKTQIKEFYIEDKILLPFHPGALKISQKGGCDIVVVGIKGAEKIKKHCIIIPTKCEAKVLTIIKNEDIVKNGTVAISEKLEGIYKGYLEK